MSAVLMEKLTFVFLIGFFVFSEMYLAKRKVWGTVTKIGMGALPIADLALKELEVRLEDGSTVRAKASPCAFCLGRYAVGDQVGITKLGKTYYLSPSLVSGGRGARCCSSAGRHKERRWNF